MPKRITRAVTLADVSDLLERPPRAHLAYVLDGRIEAGPVPFAHDAGRFYVVPPAGVAEGKRVFLLIDEGTYNAELRGVRINGALTGSETAPDGSLEVVPSSVTAWDYGAMRRRDSDEA